MKKYVIIDADAIQKRIEELEQEYKKELKQPSDVMCVLSKGMIGAYKDVLSQSTPLIPEIEKALGAGLEVGDITSNSELLKQYYIENLKLDI